MPASEGWLPHRDLSLAVTVRAWCERRHSRERVDHVHLYSAAMPKPNLGSSFGNAGAITVKTFRCGHCGRDVASERGWGHGLGPSVSIYICPYCGRPNYFEADEQTPGPRPANDVLHLPAPVAALYEEARSVMA